MYRALVCDNYCKKGNLRASVVTVEVCGMRQHMV